MQIRIVSIYSIGTCHSCWISQRQPGGNATVPPELISPPEMQGGKPAQKEAS